MTPQPRARRLSQGPAKGTVPFWRRRFAAEHENWDSLQLASRPTTLALGVCLLAIVGAARVQAAEEPNLPKPEEVVLTTADDTRLAATYYPGSKGKESVPIVLLHGWKGCQADFRELAKALHGLGHAVLLPDLRGHGDSVNLARGRPEEKLDVSKMTQLDFERMVRFDLEAIKAFLWDKNNDGQLNLNKLCLVGSEMGASLAVGFAAADWLPHGPDYPYYGRLQQGRFVKALVLISPEVSFKGMNMPRLVQSLGDLNRQIDVLILVGEEDRRLMNDARRVHEMLARWHPEPKEGDDKKEKQTLFLGPLKTSLQGTKLFGVSDLNVITHVAAFIDLRLVKSTSTRAMSWQPLKRPHE